MNKETSLQDWHIDRLESLMGQWELNDTTDMTEDQAIQVLRATQDSGKTMRQMSRMQGNLASMRETASNWMSKPSVLLPALGVSIAGAAYLADAQLSQVDLEFMKDMAAITQAEYEEMAPKVAENAGRAREVVLGVLGLGVTTAIGLHLDRFKNLFTQSGQVLRVGEGANPEGERLTQRLTDAERVALKEVMTSFQEIIAQQPAEQQTTLIDRLVESISRTEHQVAQGNSPASQISERLKMMKERLEAIETHQQAHGLRATPSAGAPSL